MNIIKNFFIFAVSVIVISVLIILFDKIGMNKNFNLLFSSVLYSVFITLYFKHIAISLVCVFAYYSLLFLLTDSLEVFWMLLTSLLTCILIEFVMPKLKKDVLISFYKTNSL